MREEGKGKKVEKKGKREREREGEDREEKRRKGVPRTRMESIRGGKCVPLVPHACFSAWGGQTREFPR